MNNTNHLIEQHIREYDSRLRHFDEDARRTGKIENEEFEYSRFGTRLAKLIQKSGRFPSLFDIFA